MTLVMYAVLCIVCLVVGGFAVFAFTKKKKNSEEQLKEGKKQGIIERIGVMNFILIILGFATLLFVLKMIQLFETYGAVPDALVTCFFALVGGECGVMGWIRTTKEAKQAREWQLEDEERFNSKNP